MATNRVSFFSVAMPTLHHRERLTRNRIFGSQAPIQRSLQQIPPWWIDNLLVSWSASMLRFHHEVANLLTCHLVFAFNSLCNIYRIKNNSATIILSSLIDGSSSGLLCDTRK
ncbi:unnamed protein product [Albugo candida]|uniref:Uncharacterized protein n=1 Tax=Albugo candida TaxID=65357 RepID=A0A024G9I4_9STRA|nr:unnamed protein product [Albugo candida]|eukprot:CCI43383.1 unnamed protein product [Albugo candida]